MTTSRLLDHPVQRLAWIVGLALLAALVAAVPARAQSCPGADLVQSAVSSLNQAAGSPQAYAQVVDRYANVSGLAMFALGPYQRALPAAQRSEYVQLTRAYIGRMLAQAGSLSGAQMQIHNCYTQGGHAFIDTSIAGRRIVWRIGDGRIADVNVGGMWLAPQLRSNFVSVIRRGNGDVAALLQYLRSNSVALR